MMRCEGRWLHGTGTLEIGSPEDGARSNGAKRGRQAFYRGD